MVWPTSCDGVAIGQGMVGWSRLRGQRLLLLRQPHPTQQVGVAGVRVQGVPDRVHFKIGERTGALLVSFFEPCESLILLAQSDINDGEAYGRHEPLLRGRSEFLDNPERLASLEGVALKRKGPRSASA